MEEKKEKRPSKKNSVRENKKHPYKKTRDLTTTKIEGNNDEY